MSESEFLINDWVNFSKYHDRINNALNHILQERYQFSLKEFYLLMFLYQSEDKKLRLSTASNMIGLSQSALSRLIIRLENHAFQPVERVVYEEDKRGFYVVLTTRGEKFTTNIITEVSSVLEASMSEKDKTNIRLFTS
ncbi:MarR family transcriptional regulator [Paenibacillus peoriae]|uniref:MarR family transcriptional regulator n=1 Tax=Paenibacillus kribbensis TaxID=172713 RepID=A0A222WQP3_9BACL|nr:MULTISPECIES: MarR family transcriptional regulator [Paenibacillus]ASR48869.1 MarR family transcriptional regulator [Paenibacillus kribbensis]MEC0182093.1 MarR family transcriptional regulator [Paenibacillus peoriae]